MDSDALLKLDAKSLAALTSGLHHGALFHDISSESIRMTLPAASTEVCDELIRLASEEKWTSSQIAYLLESIRSSKTDYATFSHLFDLVLSGPATNAVRTRDTQAVYAELIESAKEEVILASYAIYNGQELFAPLIKKHETIENFRTRIYLDIPRRRGDTTTSDLLVARYRQDFFAKQWHSTKHPELYYFNAALNHDWQTRASMHAKLIIIDRTTVFLSSANLTKAAQTKNIEAGALINDRNTADRLANHFQALFEDGYFATDSID